LAAGSQSTSRQTVASGSKLLSKAKKPSANPLAQWIGSIAAADEQQQSNADEQATLPATATATTTTTTSTAPLGEREGAMDELTKNFSRLVINTQTAEPQCYLIRSLQENVHILGTSQWCCVTGYNELGLVVDVIIDFEANRWVLNEIVLLWSDLPMLHSLTLEEKLAFGRIRWPVGTQFKGPFVSQANCSYSDFFSPGQITDLQNNTLRIIVSKQPNPKLKAPPVVTPEGKLKKFIFSFD